MDSFQKYFTLLLLCLFSFACTTAPDQKILARVDKEKIIANDLKKSFDEKKEQYGFDVVNDPEGLLAVKKILLSGLIEEKVLLQTARNKKVDLTAEEEKRLVEELKSGYSPGELEKILKGKTLPYDLWLQKQKSKKRIEKLMDQEVYARIQPAENEIRNYYRRHASLFREPDQVRCRHIIASKREKAETILSLLNKGENFASVAQQYSESPERERGGDLGYFTYGVYPTIFEQACFTLNTGQTSPVISSEYGYHIFKVLDKKPGHPLSLAEATPTILRRIREEQGRDLAKAWLDLLYQDRKITIDEKALKEVLLTP